MFLPANDIRTLIRLCPAVAALLCAHIALWLLFALPIATLEPVWQYTVGTNGAILRGEYWRLVSPIVLHRDFSHMAANSLSLYVCGPWLERALGTRRFFVLYLAGGIGANIATVLFMPPMYTHVGASGAIFALFGMYSYLALFRREAIAPRYAQLLLAVIAVNLVLALTRPNGNLMAHLFGFTTGGLLAPFLAVRLDPPPLLWLHAPKRNRLF
ncbi:rhomboid family intramembrane serine protease [Geobacillus sp. C56-T2]|uniref:rhomboid family intramembrane serine protease n=1 Tax=Geobacillus sp. C56-T2 TaxID=600773 RepID=UPI0011A8A92A|nr:rhomboid family intramembrane serine protease [Geobacillus sp. C56-T2]NNV07252.1 rhomboid family intramembrane serine protease [Geobacillus sp. MMMUD3]TWG29234.1 membrane associated rhomboid family serine protease [Geobacillus sp. C56-T2]